MREMATFHHFFKIDQFSSGDCRCIYNRKARKDRHNNVHIREVRAAEEKMKSVLDALNMAGAEDPNCLDTDEYTRAVRELEWT